MSMPRGPSDVRTASATAEEQRVSLQLLKRYRRPELTLGCCHVAQSNLHRLLSVLCTAIAKKSALSARDALAATDLKVTTGCSTRGSSGRRSCWCCYCCHVEVEGEYETTVRAEDKSEARPFWVVLLLRTRVSHLLIMVRGARAARQEATQDYALGSVCTSATELQQPFV